MIGILFLAFIIFGTLWIIKKSTSMSDDTLVCPKCGGRLHYRISDEQNPISSLHYVDYWCEKCNYKITLPPR